MIVIVGHGPSANSVDGSWLDSQVVVRLKDPYGLNDSSMAHRGVTPGTRTDIMCSRHTMYRRGYEQYPYWLYPRKPVRPKIDGVWVADVERWSAYWAENGGVIDGKTIKPSSGMCAIFCAIENGWEKIGLVGFDSFFYDCDVNPHIGYLERRIAESLCDIENCSPADCIYGEYGELKYGG